MKNTYEQYTEITKELLDSIKVGDLVKVNDWKKPLRVKGVGANFFVMSTKQFKDQIYSVCKKIPETDGLFYTGPDWWTCGWFNGYDFENQEAVADYLDSFERHPSDDYHSELSARRAIAIHFIGIKRCK